MPIDHISNRDFLLRSLQEELVGPAPAGPSIDCANVTFAERADAYGPFRQARSGEEIIVRDTPTRRYGVGVLYQCSSLTVTGGEDVLHPADSPELPLSDEARLALETIEQRNGSAAPDAGEDSLDLSGASGLRPSSMAVSFLATLSSASRLFVRASGGRYDSTTILVEGKERTWWLRRPVTLCGDFAGAHLLAATSGRLLGAEIAECGNCDGLDIRIEIYARPTQAPNQRLVTVCLINRTPTAIDQEAGTLFQAGFEVELCDPTHASGILPYPAPPISNLDLEEQGLELLYHRRKTFAVGHGCSADWDEPSDSGATAKIRAVSLPRCETPSMTPNVADANGHEIAVPMHLLADGDQTGLDSLRRIVDLYTDWIADQTSAINDLPSQYRPAAVRHLEACARCAERMEDGLQLLFQDADAREAFSLANRAVLYQQLNAGREPRWVTWGPDGKRSFSERFDVPDTMSERGQKPTWRAFQIAFLLLSLRPAVSCESAERDTVELIWFPTGGGKTEAYLGLAAFSAIYRRLKNPADNGVHVLMRYTLRLLTAQQFQRAARLICAMEVLRREHLTLKGSAPFSIGIWLGGDTTPNSRKDAVAMLKKLLKGNSFAENGFLLDRCPWCRAEIGVLAHPSRQVKVLGYQQQGNTVAFCCSDPKCAFERSLPVYVIDDDVYQERPTLLIGTVDKFASLAWKPEARAIFGLSGDGSRQCSPPGLIIQDELHLISGPLGSVVGLYETLIEELCTDYRHDPPVRPKIVCSTATIRRYEAQVRALYGRPSVALFPPPALDAGDSFFARYAKTRNGAFERGRIYVGVHAPGLSSMQTVQVRSFSAMLSAVLPLSPEERDPWWTLLLFFNSLRELGGTVSLLQSDVPDYLRTISNRSGSPSLRYLDQILELTSRLTREEVPKALSDLEVTTVRDDRRAVDVCLASSIIEVGVDIDRLSLMSIVGQPKTTAQYIQVSGRVGRQWKDRPGMVVTLYGATKARDRSHYEKFRTYHERLYAEVEPTSVTPFSPQVVERVLHAVMAAFVRQTGAASNAASPAPCPTWMLHQLSEILYRRVALIDKDELPAVKAVFDRRLAEWEHWQSRLWSNSPDGSEIPLLRAAGSYAPLEWRIRSWATPQSMRNVDAECQAEITQLYN